MSMSKIVWQPIETAPMRLSDLLMPKPEEEKEEEKK